MLLSGDDLTRLEDKRIALLNRAAENTGVAAEFADEQLQAGVIRERDRLLLVLMNWDDESADRSVALPEGNFQLSDYWSGEELGIHTKAYRAKQMAPHSGRLIIAEPQ